MSCVVMRRAIPHRTFDSSTEPAAGRRLAAQERCAGSRLVRSPSAVVVGPLLLLAIGPRAPLLAQANTILLRDATIESQIAFTHTDGSSGRRYLIESMSAGAALFDYDGDGDLDIYFLNGAPLEGAPTDAAPSNALYRNDGGFRFTEVTEAAKVGDTGYGLGVAAGDYDNDGDSDLYIANFGANVFYENQGDGTFLNIARRAGADSGSRVGAGVAFLDIENDGDLDLYVANYVKFSVETHQPRTLRGLPAYPSPLGYDPEPDTLYRNEADGTFTDISESSGVAAHAGRGMGVVCSDYDNDGDIDIFVANDVQANFLFNNDGRGSFDEVGLLSGIAYDFAGRSQASMGVDAADFDNDGLIDFHITNFAGELSALYRNLGGGAFEDATRLTRAGEGTFPHVTWGNGFADFDNDGDRDLFVGAGHVDDNLHLRGGEDTTAFAVRNILLRNNNGESFTDVSSTSGDGLKVQSPTRGIALGDLDQDGDVDVVAVNSRSKPTLLRNETGAANHWIKLRLIGQESNREAVGARVTVVTGLRQQLDEVRSGRGYQSHFGTELHFGVAGQSHVDRIEVRWPSGSTQVWENLPANQTAVLREGLKIATRYPLD